VSEFVVETYVSREMASFLARRVKDVAVASERVSQDGAQVRLLRAIFLPEEETCFYLFETASADAVGEAVRRAALRFARITKAASITPHDVTRARPRAAGAPEHPAQDSTTTERQNE
jgi:hypothetical protein